MIRVVVVVLVVWCVASVVVALAFVSLCPPPSPWYEEAHDPGFQKLSDRRKDLEASDQERGRLGA